MRKLRMSADIFATSSHNLTNMLKNKCKKWLGAENNALTDLWLYILELLNIFGDNTILMVIW